MLRTSPRLNWCPFRGCFGTITLFTCACLLSAATRRKVRGELLVTPQWRQFGLWIVESQNLFEPIP